MIDANRTEGNAKSTAEPTSVEATAPNGKTGVTAHSNKRPLRRAAGAEIYG
jgi:hypothetical protein